MTKIDDYLKPLHQGVWEIAIPKENVTELPGEEWVKSTINIPSPGTIASYRNGQYHVHETKTEWRVHLDRYDPKKHPFLHLIDDAPLFLMISETIITLFSEARGRSTHTQDIIKNQETFIRNGTLFGLFLILLGLTFVLSPEKMYISLFEEIIPFFVILVGIIAIVKGIDWRSRVVNQKKEIIYGGFTIILGCILGYIPLIFWSLLLISILGAWMFFSAALLFNRIRKGKSAVPEGFYSRLAIAIISLILFITIFYAPAIILELLFIILGIIIMLAGCVLITTTVKLKNRSDPY